MKINRLASVICRGTWLMDPRYAMGMMPMVARFLNGQPVSFFDAPDEDEDPVLATYCISPEGTLIASTSNGFGNLYQDAPVGSLMIINIEGTILKDDNCGAPGTDTMSAWIKEAVWSDNIAGIVLKINSGGGSVEGTGEFAEVITWADTYKPVVAYTDGLCASAAYWIASACRRIFASYKTVEVGSIGTAIKFLDNRKAMEEYGYKEHYINADASVDKNQDYYKALDGNYTPIKTHVLNPTNDVFLSAVRTNREGLLVETESKEGNITRIEPISGNVYLAEAAIKNGLIDEIGSFDHVCEYTLDLAKNPTDKPQKSNNMFNKFSKLAALAGKAAESITAEQVDTVNEQIEAAKIAGVTLVLDSTLENLTTGASAEEVTRLTAEVASLTTAKNTAEQSLATANTALAAAEADRDTWKEKAVEFGASAADEHTKGKKKGTDDIEDTDNDEDDEDNFHSEADAEVARIRANRTKLPSFK